MYPGIKKNNFTDFILNFNFWHVAVIVVANLCHMIVCVMWCTHSQWLCECKD